MTSSSAGEALPSVYTTRPGEALPRWLCAELAQLDRASVYETEGRRFDSCIPRHLRSVLPALSATPPPEFRFLARQPPFQPAAC